MSIYVYIYMYIYTTYIYIYIEAGGYKNHGDDPVATMLANTFKAHDLNNTLDGVIQDRSLLGSWVKCFAYLLLNCSVISVFVF
jgi:hypothetical protein